MSTNYSLREILRKYPGMILLVITGSLILAACASAGTPSTSPTRTTLVQGKSALTRSIAGVQRCHAAQLELKMARNAHGAAYATPYGSGQANRIIEFVNTSSSTCELTGTPAPEEVTNSGASMPVSVNDKFMSSFSTLPGEPAVKIFDTPVDLSTGEGAAFVVETNYWFSGFIPPGSTHGLSRSSGLSRSDIQPPPLSAVTGPPSIGASPVFPASLAGAIISTRLTGNPGSDISTLAACQQYESSGPGQTIGQLASYEHWSQSQVASRWHAEFNLLCSSTGNPVQHFQL